MPSDIEGTTQGFILQNLCWSKEIKVFNAFCI